MPLLLLAYAHVCVCVWGDVCVKLVITTHRLPLVSMTLRTVSRCQTARLACSSATPACAITPQLCVCSQPAAPVILQAVLLDFSRLIFPLQ